MEEKTEVKRQEVREGIINDVVDVHTVTEEYIPKDNNEELNSYNQLVALRNELADVTNTLKLEVEQKQEILEVNNNKLDDMDIVIDAKRLLLVEVGLVPAEVQEEEEVEDGN